MFPFPPFHGSYEDVRHLTLGKFARYGRSDFVSLYERMPIYPGWYEVRPTNRGMTNALVASDISVRYWNGECFLLGHSDNKGDVFRAEPDRWNWRGLLKSAMKPPTSGWNETKNEAGSIIRVFWSGQQWLWNEIRPGQEVLIENVCTRQDFYPFKAVRGPLKEKPAKGKPGRPSIDKRRWPDVAAGEKPKFNMLITIPAKNDQQQA